MLGACFGASLDGLEYGVDGGSARDLGAIAFTDGARITTRDDVAARARVDPRAAETLAHETAHALAGGGTGQTLVDLPGDPGERMADDAGRQFRRFVEGGMRGPPPALRPATGGRARFHRQDTDEHLKTVKDAQSNVLNHAGVTPEQISTANNAQGLIEQEIVLGNGVTVTSDQITALMGDYYGVYDECGQFDPVKSFEQLWNADVKELETLKVLLAQEASGQHVNFWQYEEALKGRSENGQLGYLDLAQLNSAHFSGDTMQGADNNMSVYTEYHEQALKLAQTNPNMALAYEAASMHFLTDRQASGHQFNKDQVLDAATDTPVATALNESDNGALNSLGSYVPNLVMLGVHDLFNEEGLQVSNANGDTWTAFGDGQWDDKEGDSDEIKTLKEQSRFQTALSVTASYDELAQVMSGEKTVEQIQDEGYAAYGTAPEWSDDVQLEAEALAEDALSGELSLDTLSAMYKLLPQIGERLFDTGVDTINYAGPMMMDWLDQSVDGATDWAGQSLDGALDWAVESGGQGLDWAMDAGQSLWNWGGDTAGGALDWGESTLNGLWDWGASSLAGGWDWLGDTAEGAWDWGADSLSQVTDWGANTLDGLSDWGAEGTDRFTNWLSNAPEEIYDDPIGWLSASFDGAKDFAGDTSAQILEWTGNTISGAAGWGWNTLTDLGGWGWDTVTDLGEWGWDTVTDLGGWGWNTLTDLGGWGWNTLTDLGGWELESLAGLVDWGADSGEQLLDWGGNSVDAVADWGTESISGFTSQLEFMSDTFFGAPKPKEDKTSCTVPTLETTLEATPSQ